MYLYHFLSFEHAMHDLKNKYIKVAKVKDVNDPFDLSPFQTDDQNIKIHVDTMKKALHEMMGMLCFTNSWSDPVMWGHYADKHKGICLGFEIMNTILEKVKYIKERLAKGSGSDCNLDEFKNLVFFIKSCGWKYENEWRCLIEFKDCKIDGSGNYFYPFGDHLTLKEIIVGASSELSVDDVANTINGEFSNVIIRKASLSTIKFEIEEKPPCKKI